MVVQLKDHIRQYILITLSHAEHRPEVSGEQIISRLRAEFTCISIVVCKESHRDSGYHYHVGLRNSSASRYTATKRIRELFAEFDGSQCNVSYRKGWNTICAYLWKEDRVPVCWGEDSLKDVLLRAQSYEKKRQGPELAQLLGEKKNWDEVLADKRLRAKAMSNYSSVRRVFADMRSKK